MACVSAGWIKLGFIFFTGLVSYSFCRENSSAAGLELTLKEAVEYLSHPDESHQQCGATFIQHAAFKEEQAKQKV